MNLILVAPSSCRVCGCTDYSACPLGCTWVEQEGLDGLRLCSSCAPPAADPNIRYEVDPERAAKMYGETGIHVRAVDHEGRWGPFDIAELKKESLARWLRSRGGANAIAEKLVLYLMGHEISDNEEGWPST